LLAYLGEVEPYTKKLMRDYGVVIKYQYKLVQQAINNSCSVSFPVKYLWF